MINIKKILFMFLVALALMILSCASPQDKAYEAQEKVHNERLELIEQYQECLKKVEKNNTDKDVCDQYLKAAEALK